MLLLVTAASAAWLVPFMDRRSALKAGGASFVAAGVPLPALAAVEANTAKSFQEIQKVAAASLPRAAPLLDKIEYLQLARNKASFLLPGSSLCKSPDGYVSVRFWRVLYRRSTSDP